MCLDPEDVPFVFHGGVAAWRAFRSDLREKLGSVEADIRIVGSGRFGYSMRPEQPLKRYSPQSDVDVLVADATLFDRLWSLLLQAGYPRGTINPRLERMGLQRLRESLYTGWINPDEIRFDWGLLGSKSDPLRREQFRWFDSLKKVATHVKRPHSEIKGRVYRTLEHARQYHRHSLAALRAALAKDA